MQVPAAAGTESILSVKYRNLEERSGKQQPHGEEGKENIEHLAYHIEYERFASLHLMYDILEIRIKSNAGKCEDEAPVLVLSEHFVDALDEFLAAVQRKDYE